MEAPGQGPPPAPATAAAAATTTTAADTAAAAVVPTSAAAEAATAAAGTLAAAGAASAAATEKSPAAAPAAAPADWLEQLLPSSSGKPPRVSLCLCQHIRLLDFVFKDKPKGIGFSLWGQEVQLLWLQGFITKLAVYTPHPIHLMLLHGCDCSPTTRHS